MKGKPSKWNVCNDAEMSLDLSMAKLFQIPVYVD